MAKKKAKKSKKKVKKNLGGRPQKLTFDQTLLSCVEALAKEGKTNDQIADIFNIHRDTFYRYQSMSKKFSDAVKSGKSVADDMVEQALYHRAIGSNGEPPNPTCMIFWLKNRRSNDWRDKKESEVDLTVNNLHEALAKVIDDDES